MLLKLRNNNNIKWKAQYWNSAVYTNVSHTPSIYNRRAVKGWRKELIPRQTTDINSAGLTFIGGRSKQHLGSFNTNPKSILSTYNNNNNNICSKFKDIHITTDSIDNQNIAEICNNSCKKKNKVINTDILINREKFNKDNYSFTTKEYLQKKNKSYQKNLCGNTQCNVCTGGLDVDNFKYIKTTPTCQPPMHPQTKLTPYSTLIPGVIGATSSGSHISSLKYNTIRYGTYKYTPNSHYLNIVNIYNDKKKDSANNNVNINTPCNKSGTVFQGSLKNPGNRTTCFKSKSRLAYPRLSCVKKDKVYY